MSRIDRVRLAEIFRTLSSTSKPATKSDHGHDEKSVHFKKDDSGVSRESQLKANIKNRLAKLRNEADNFEQEAPLAAVEEVLLWEFGSEILSDPDFKHISEKVSQSIVNAPELNKHLLVMFQELES